MRECHRGPGNGVSTPRNAVGNGGKRSPACGNTIRFLGKPVTTCGSAYRNVEKPLTRCGNAISPSLVALRRFLSVFPPVWERFPRVGGETAMDQVAAGVSGAGAGSSDLLRFASGHCPSASVRPIMAAEQAYSHPFRGFDAEDESLPPSAPTPGPAPSAPTPPALPPPSRSSPSPPRERKRQQRGDRDEAGRVKNHRPAPSDP